MALMTGRGRARPRLCITPRCPGGGTLDQDSALVQHQDGLSRGRDAFYDGFFTKMLKGALHASRALAKGSSI